MILPVITAVTHGAGTDSGKLILGDATTARNQTLAGLVTAGTGTSNSVVGAASANSVLTLNIANGITDTYTGTLGGPGTNENDLALTKSGAGTLVLTGNNNYVGNTTLTAGILNLGSANAIGTVGIISFGGGTLQYSTVNTADYASRFTTTGNNDYKIDTNGQNVIYGTGLAASGTSGLTKSGGGVLTLATTGNSYTGSTTINGGVLVTPDATTPTVKLGGGVWQPALTGNLNITSTLATSTGAGQINTWTSGGVAAVGGKITVSLNGGAALNWGTASFMASGTTPIVFGSAAANNQVEFQNSFDFGSATGTLSANFDRVIEVDGPPATVVGGTTGYGVSGASTLISGVIAANMPVSGTPTNTTAGDLGNNGFKKTGSGTLIFGGSNTYSGKTTVSAGTLIAGCDGLAGVAGCFGDGHTVTQSNLTAPVTITGNQAIVLGFGNINGTDGTAANGASPTVLIGGAFTVAAPVTINDIATTGTYRIGGSTANNSTFAGLVTTAQPLSVSQVAGGTLNLTGGITGGANAAIKTISFDTPAAIVVGTGVISNGPGGGKLAISKTNSGTLTLSGANTYTGDTSVNGGTLIVNGNQSTATGAMTVGNAATLGGSGTLGGAITINSGGILAPGTAIGTLTAASATFAASSSFNVELDGSTADRLSVSGVLDITGAALHITQLAPAAAAAYIIASYGSLTGTQFAAVTGMPSGYTLDYNYQSNHQIALVQGSQTPYDLWAAGTFAHPFTNTAPGADPDGDGISNLLEFVFGGDPTVSDAASILPAATASGNDLVVTFQRSHAAEMPPAVVVKVQVSDDLASWPAATDIVIGASTDAGPIGTTGASYTVTANGAVDTIVVTIPKGTATNRYARVNATQP